MYKIGLHAIIMITPSTPSTLNSFVITRKQHENKRGHKKMKIINMTEFNCLMKSKEGRKDQM